MPKAWAPSPRRPGLNISELEAALERARSNAVTTVIVIDTDPLASTEAGGHWWDVAVAEVSERDAVKEARRDYERVVRNRQPGE